MDLSVVGLIGIILLMGIVKKNAMTMVTGKATEVPPGRAIQVPR